MERKGINEYFNCDAVPGGQQAYQGKHMGFYAVAEHIDDGYAFAKALPLPQARGLDAFENKPLPGLVLFIYPEHTLVPRQHQQFVRQLVERYPDVHGVIIVTTSAVIISDTVTCEVLKNPPRSSLVFACFFFDCPLDEDHARRMILFVE